MSVYASKTNGTGSGAIAVSASAPAGDRAHRLKSVTVHFDSAPASAGSLTITLDANAGAAYDTLLASRSMVGVTDYVYQPDHDLDLVAGDAIDVAYTNPDSRTYGVEITLEVLR